MLSFASYIIIFGIVGGLVLTKPIEDNAKSEQKSQDVLFEEAFREAEKTLNRYFSMMDSDTDQIVHAMLYILLNNPKSFPFVPHRALDIALKNVEKKLGKHDLDVLVKPMILSIEQNAQNKQNQSSVPITDELKHQIENALDEYFAEHENIADV